MEFTKTELNALNKLLGRIKFETHLDADEVNFFATSPFIISAFEKIHLAYLKEFGNFSKIDKITKRSYGTKEIQARLRSLSESGKKWFRQATLEQKKEYAKALFAPFEAEQEILDEVLNTINSL